ncbi:hypothetical protein STW0522PSE72_22420 [Pseudomonas monteilii]|nr:hypothetical protein STW0522PSE72_22420 [Pseudomonas monteilii]
MLKSYAVLVGAGLPAMGRKAALGFQRSRMKKPATNLLKVSMLLKSA